MLFAESTATLQPPSLLLPAVMVDSIPARSIFRIWKSTRNGATRTIVQTNTFPAASVVRCVGESMDDAAPPAHGGGVEKGFVALRPFPPFPAMVEMVPVASILRI